MTADAGDLWRSDTRGLTVRTADSRTAGRVVHLAIGQWNDRPSVSHVVFARRGRRGRRGPARRLERGGPFGAAMSGCGPEPSSSPVQRPPPHRCCAATIDWADVHLAASGGPSSGSERTPPRCAAPPLPG